MVMVPGKGKRFRFPRRVLNACAENDAVGVGVVVVVAVVDEDRGAEADVDNDADFVFAATARVTAAERLAA